MRYILIALAGWFIVSLSARISAKDEPDGGDQKQRGKSIKNLLKLSAALVDYDKKTLLSHAIFSKEGKPLLSWRVAVLPLLGEKDLYQQFKLDEPWDSDHNKQLLDKIPAIYTSAAGKAKEKSSTFYQVFVGPNAAFEGKRGIRLPEITNGTSNTALLAESFEAVPWTKPVDIVYEKGKPLKLGGLFKDGAHVCCCDGERVFFVKENIPDRMLRQMIARFSEVADEDRSEFVKLVAGRP